MKNDPWMENYLADYDFSLPDELIARYPPERRDQARLLVVHRKEQRLEDRSITDLPLYLRQGDLLVRNNTRVSPRRVILQRSTGALLPALFLEPRPEGEWLCLMKGVRKLKEGELLSPAPALRKGEKSDSGLLFRFRREQEGGEVLLLPLRREEFPSPPESGKEPPGRAAWQTPGEAEEFFAEWGEVPLPPYLQREAEELDRERYQTLYARNPGSVAAPTAGFHLTGTLMEQLEQRGVEFVDVELRIGFGTFAPLQPENLRENRLHRELYTIPPETARRLEAKRQDATGRIIAVGTTALRALESDYRRHEGRFRAGSFETTLFLRPPETLRSAQGLLTNFHLPRSSLLMLVSTLAGRELILHAYRHGVREGYRFFSYGDAMLIL